MKNYTITVNGNAYDVTVEEGTGAGAPTASAAPAAPRVAAPAPKAAPAAPKAPAASGSAGAVKITSPMPGKILSIKTSVGAAVKQSDVVAVLEAMKMENEIVAPQDGTIASIDVTEGAQVEAGATLISMN